MFLLEVMNPVAAQRGLVSAASPNKRPVTLDNKTVGLVWSGTHGGDLALKRAGEMLQAKFRGVKVNFYNSGGYPTPPKMLKQAAADSDVVIGATAD